MKRANGTTDSPKKQKVPLFFYDHTSDHQSKEFDNIRIVPWLNDDPILENRQQILTTISAIDIGWQPFDVFKYASFLKLLVYNISNPYIANTGNSSAEGFGKMSSSSAPLLIGWGGSRAFLLGFAVVVPWIKENVRKLTYMRILYEGANLGRYLYKSLRTLDSKIVIYNQFSPKFDFAYWKKIGALADTKKVWQPRNPNLLGLGCKDEAVFLKDINRAEMEKLYEDVSRLFASFRDWLLVYLRIALDCDGPILEAISCAWPEGLYAIPAKNTKGGLELAFPWQLNEKTTPMGRRYMLLNKLFSKRNRGIRFGSWMSGPGEPGDILALARSVTPFSLKKKYQMIEFLPFLPSLFLAHGIHLQGSIFGHYIGLDTFE